MKCEMCKYKKKALEEIDLGWAGVVILFVLGMLIGSLYTHTNLCG